jgi:hypothetical protein
VEGVAGERRAGRVRDDKPAAIETAPPVDDKPADDTTDKTDKSTAAEDDKDGEAAADDDKDDKGEDDKGSDEDAGDDETGDAPVAIFDEDETLETFTEKKKAILEQFDLEKTPELKAILEHQDKLISEYAQTAEQYGALPNKETVLKFGAAITALYDPEIDPETGEFKPNAEPLVEAMRAELKQEFRPIAEKLLESDSEKYQGLSMMEEIMVDYFGPEKADRMMRYGKANEPLPTIPATLRLPAGIDEKNKEAYWQLSENKRFEIEGLVDQVARLEAEIPEASDYYKEELAKQVRELRDKLDGEVFAIDNIQRNIDGQRQSAEIQKRQLTQAAVQFRNQVATSYNNEIFGLMDTFAKDLAPRLTYADTDTQLSQARNIESRVINALGFIINGDGTLADDPAAEFFAKQLSEEGVKFDFNQGRELLKSQYKAIEKLEALKIRNASKQAIEVAEAKLRDIRFNIKSETKSLLGQLSAKYVRSNGQALKKQVDAIQEKKTVGRLVTKGRSAGGARQGDVNKDIQDYNRKVAASIKDGDDLYATYTG